jgi:ankyrin repeat protein
VKKILAQLARLAREGVNVNVNMSWSARGATALRAASMRGYTDVVALLLAHEGVDVNHQGYHGVTALMSASIRGYTDVVALLLAHEGVDVNQWTTDTGCTALFYASEQGYADVVRHLLGHAGVKVNQGTTDTGWTALMTASLNGNKDVVALLLGHEGVDVNHRSTDDSMTALMAASVEGHADVVALLLAHEGMDVDVNHGTTKHGITALMLASQGGHKDVVARLLAREDIHVDKTSDTALPTALDVAKGAEVAQLLRASLGTCVSAKTWKNKGGSCWFDAMWAALLLNDTMYKTLRLYVPSDIQKELETLKKGFSGDVDDHDDVRDQIFEYCREASHYEGHQNPSLTKGGFAEASTRRFLDHTVLWGHEAAFAAIRRDSLRVGSDGVPTVVGYTLQSIVVSSEEHSIAYVRCAGDKWVVYDDNNKHVYKVDIKKGHFFVCAKGGAKGGVYQQLKRGRLSVDPRPEDTCFKPFQWGSGDDGLFLFTKDDATSGAGPAMLYVRNQLREQEQRHLVSDSEEQDLALPGLLRDFEGSREQDLALPGLLRDFEGSLGGGGGGGGGGGQVHAVARARAGILGPPPAP